MPPLVNDQLQYDKWNQVRMIPRALGRDMSSIASLDVATCPQFLPIAHELVAICKVCYDIGYRKGMKIDSNFSNLMVTKRERGSN